MPTEFEKSIIDQLVQNVTSAVRSCDRDPAGCIRYIQYVKGTINNDQFGHTEFVKTYINNVCDLFISSIRLNCNVPPDTN